MFLENSNEWWNKREKSQKVSDAFRVHTLNCCHERFTFFFFERTMERNLFASKWKGIERKKLSRTLLLAEERNDRASGVRDEANGGANSLSTERKKKRGCAGRDCVRARIPDGGAGMMRRVSVGPGRVPRMRRGGDESRLAFRERETQ